MYFRSQYKNNKISYLNLKNIIQFGGTEHNNTDNINEIKEGDTYVYTYNDINYIFDVILNSQIGGAIEFKSRIMSLGCNPGVAIHIRILNGEGKLIYIRTNKEVQGYGDSRILLTLFKCLMKKLKICTIKLDDDAKFYNSDCSNSYSALMYRAFEGKLSLYLTEKDVLEESNFQPNYTINYVGRKNHINNGRDYLNAIKILSNSTCGDWEKYIKKIEVIYGNDWESKNLKVPPRENSDIFFSFIKKCVESKNVIIIDKLLNNIIGISEGKFRNYLIYDNYGVSGFEEKSKLYDLPREIFKTTETLSTYSCNYTC